MYIDILKTKEMNAALIKEEAPLIRLALLMSDKVEIIGVCSFFLMLKNYFESLSLERKLSFIKANMEIIYGDDPKIVNAINRAADLYLSMMRRKRKKNDVVLEMMKLKPYLDSAQKSIFEFYDQIAVINNITDLQKFTVENGNDVVSVILSEKNSKENIQIIKDLIASGDDIILFDSRIFKIATPCLINNNHNSLAGLTFVYRGIMCMDDITNISFDRLKPVRDRIISETGAFRNYLQKLKEALRRTKYSSDSLPAFEELSSNAAHQGAEFEKKIEANLLLNKLILSCGKLEKIKVSLAVTSFDNLLKMLYKMELINETEMMYVSQHLSKNLDLSMSVPFLISEVSWI